jgi:hypothetical protein
MMTLCLKAISIYFNNRTHDPSHLSHDGVILHNTVDLKYLVQVGYSTQQLYLFVSSLIKETGIKIFAFFFNRD